MNRLKDSFLALARNKWFCLSWLIFGCAYMTIYGFLHVVDPLTEGLKNVNILGVMIEPTMTATASVIGKTYFWGFKGWGLFQSVALTLSILYMYRRYNFKSKAGIVCMILGTCCICTTVMIRSTEEFGLQLVAHWSTALLFGVFYAIAIGLCLLRMSKQSKKFLVTFIVFVAMLAAMIGLLVAFGKSGAIESIPMWGAYLILLLANFTGLYKDSLPERA